MPVPSTSGVDSRPTVVFPPLSKATTGSPRKVRVGTADDSSAKNPESATFQTGMPQHFGSTRIAVPASEASSEASDIAEQPATSTTADGEKKPVFVTSPLTQFLATRQADAALEPTIISSPQRSRASVLLSKTRPGALRVQLDLRAEQEIKTTYGQIISFHLGLGDYPEGTPWRELNPYEPSIGQAAEALKSQYLDKMLDATAFAAGAEFQSLVNEINASVLNIVEPGLVKNLLSKSGVGAEELHGASVSLKNQTIKDNLWMVTAGYCLDFFDAAATQHCALSAGAVTEPDHRFTLLLDLQSFNVRFSVLERAADGVKYNHRLTSKQRMEILTDLQQQAVDLQTEVGTLYQRCQEYALSTSKMAFILGDPVVGEHSEALRSNKVAEFKKRMDQAIKELKERTF